MKQSILLYTPKYLQFLEQTCQKRGNFHKRANITFNLFRRWVFDVGLPYTKCKFFFIDLRPYMPRKQGDWIFATIQLNETHEPAIAEFIGSYAGDVVKIIEALLSAEYKLSVSWVDDAEAFCAALTGGEKHPHNPNTTLTAWSDSIVEAVFLVGFKHFVISDGRRWNVEQKSRKRWG